MTLRSLPLLAGAMLLGITMAAPAHAQMRALSDPVEAHPNPESLFTSDDPVLHRNKQAALRIQRELLKCNQWARADEWLTDAYIQHNPVAASGLKGVQEYFINVAKRQPTDPCPALSAQDPNGVVAVMAEGDYVTILTKRSVPYADDPSQSYTTTWFDTWRFVDGKADEHWDPATLPTQAPPAAAPEPASPAQASVGQEADRVAIQKLMWDYVRAADPLDADAYVQLFTPDGSFGGTQGRDGLHKMIADLKTSQAERASAPGAEPMGNMHHIMSNQFIEFASPTEARVHYYWQTVFGGPGVSPVPRVAAVGNGVDDVVKQDGRWLIRSRNVQPTREME